MDGENIHKYRIMCDSGYANTDSIQHFYYKQNQKEKLKMSDR